MELCAAERRAQSSAHICTRTPRSPVAVFPRALRPAQAKSALHPLPFYLEEDPATDGGRSVEQQLDDAAAEAEGRGIPVKALLVG